jgi:hypothetical protein
MTQIAYKLAEAAEQVSVSVSTLRRAIKTTDPNAFPPPLAAKNVGTDAKPSYRVSHVVLMAWFDRLQDA